ncbi:hypothetical protein [Candidatus Palauibacter sp.]|uniref:hypothetical protein n=1 Tax=Candidatus Palauibacter sp. TaxID=3101350 RepID=UPI003C6F3842
MDAKVRKNMPGPRNGATVDPRSRAARLGDLSRRVPPPSIADIWLFPPLPQLEDSSEFLLFTRILEDGKRALYSARMVPANGTPAHQVVVEHGRAPADRVPSLVAGLQRRLKQPTPARHVSIDGDDERWEAFLRQSREADATD